MKKRMRIFTAAVLAVVALSLCGCSVFNVFSVDSLIKAPRLAGDNAEIQQAFESAVGSDVSLVRPVSGDYRSAYVLHDYDGDGVNEAIVFYMPNATAGEVRMHFLKYDENEKKWMSVADVKGNGSDVHSITFCNFDRDSVAEIAVAWAFADGQRDKMLTVYRYSANEITGDADFISLASVRISDFNFLDIDFDGADELLYTIIDAASEQPTPVFKSLKYDVAASRFVPLSEVQLDNRISSFVNYSHDLKAGNYRFYIDAQLSDGRYITDIVYYDYSRSTFTRPLDENGIPLGDSTLRRNGVLSEDINDDGVIEIPKSELYEKSELVSPAEGEDNRVYVTEYCDFDGEKLVSLGKYYTCGELGIRIKLDKYLGTAYIRIDITAGNITFFSYPEEGKNDSSLLFTVYVPKSGSQDGESEKDGVTVSITQSGKEMGITPDSVKEDLIQIKTESIL